MSNSLKVLCLIGASIALLAIGFSKNQKATKPAAVTKVDQPGTPQQASQPSAPASRAMARAALVESKLRQALLEKTRFSFVEVPLQEAVGRLAEQHQLPLRLDEAKLSDEGIEIEQPVTLTVSDISLRSGLKLLLHPLQLTFVVEDEVIKITTAGSACELLEIRIYDVENLVHLPGEVGADFQPLIDLIFATVSPDTWDTVGGEGSLPELPPYYLVIRQTQAVHEEIEQLLEDLRHALSIPAEKAPAEERETSDRAARRKIHEKLVQPAAFEVVEKPLRDAIAQVAEAASIPIWMHEVRLGDEGVALDQPVTLSVAGVRWQSVLELLLRPLQLGWIIEDEVLKITTKGTADERLSARVYDVRDLTRQLEAARRPRSPLFIRVPRAVGPMYGPFGDPIPGGGFGGGFQVLELKQFGGPGNSMNWRQSLNADRDWLTGSAEGTAEPLMGAILSAIAPYSWDRVGGEGNITEFHGLLVVRQSYHRYLAVQKFLDELRDNQAQRQIIVAHQPPPAADDWLFVIYDVGDHPADELVRILPEFVAPETWQPAGGKGIIRAARGRLLVQQTRRVHQQLLTTLDRIVERPAPATISPQNPNPPAKPADSNPTSGQTTAGQPASGPVEAKPIKP